MEGFKCWHCHLDETPNKFFSSVKVKDLLSIKTKKDSYSFKYPETTKPDKFYYK